MARLARLYAPNTPQLIQVRFNRSLGSPLEPAPSGKLNLLADWLRDAASEEKVPVHGWVLLNDRLVLLCTPPAKTGTARLVQAVGRRYATRIQRGRAFAERYRSALLQPDAWVLKGLIWLEHLPVQLEYVDEPSRWPWSSAAQHTGQGQAALRWTTEHPDYWRLGNTPFERQARYRRLLEQGPSAAQAQELERALFGQWALGDEEFLARINHMSSRRLAPAKRGRPAKSARPIKLDAPQQEPSD
ncbi:hypothetical protein [Pusillimonas sp.]|uniref:hypothetical protein n=1 Tax=Pusillimonas sp. TaxID=3040095 RepID=UPI0037C93ABD